MRESRIEKRGGQLLRREGFESLKLGKDGTPDRIVFLSLNRHFFIEWKTPTGRLTVAQVRRIPKLLARGELVFILDNPIEAVMWARKLVRSGRWDLWTSTCQEQFKKARKPKKGSIKLAKEVDDAFAVEPGAWEHFDLDDPKGGHA